VPITTLSRLVSVFAGLANLVILAGPNDLASACRRGDVGQNEFLPPVLTIVIAGFMTSEINLRWFKPLVLAEKLSHRHGTMVVAVCLGGILMRFLLAAALTLNSLLIECGSPDHLRYSSGYWCR